MPAVREETVLTAAEFVSLAVDQATAARAAALAANPDLLPGEGHLWFRGVAKASHELIPGVLRANPGVAVNDLVEREREMLQAFTTRSAPYQGLRPLRSWEYLFLMQHYGVPTRLLDWTESAMTGLYFAVSDSEKTGYETDAVVWVLNPASWNQTVLGYMAPPGKILASDSPGLQGYEPGIALDRMSDKTVAMYALLNSPRIVSQRGVFTIFGLHNEPMEVMHTNLAFPTDTLVKLVLPQAALPTLREELTTLGMGETSIYPDLEALGRELRREFGY